MILKLFARNIILYAMAVLILAKCINANECFTKRGKYLLGIVYNGFFLNGNDKIVYEDYLKRHGTTPEAFQKNL